MLVDSKELLLTDDLVIKKANFLAQNSMYVGKFVGAAPSVLEHKLLECIIASLQECSELKPIRITAQEFWAHFGIKDYTSGNYLALFANAAIKLRSQSAFVPTNDPIIEDPTGTKKYVEAVGIFDRVQVRADQKDSVFIVNPIMALGYLNLESNYYAYPLSESKNMTTKYGRLLFELLYSYKNINKPIKLTFEELAEKIDATKYLKRAADFKRFVIESAVEDINNHCPNTSVTYAITKLRPGKYLVTFVISADFTDSQLVLFEKQRENETLVAVKKQIDYDVLCHEAKQRCPEDLSTIDLIVEIMVDVYTTSEKSLPIQKGSKVPTYTVRERYKKLDKDQIQWVLYTIKNKSKGPIKTPYSYVRTTLFNAPLTTNIQITSMVNAEKWSEDTAPSDERKFDEDELRYFRQIKDQANEE